MLLWYISNDNVIFLIYTSILCLYIQVHLADKAFVLIPQWYLNAEHHWIVAPHNMAQCSLFPTYCCNCWILCISGFERDKQVQRHSKSSQNYFFYFWKMDWHPNSPVFCSPDHLWAGWMSALRLIQRLYLLLGDIIWVGLSREGWYQLLFEPPLHGETVVSTVHLSH